MLNYYIVKARSLSYNIGEMYTFEVEMMNIILRKQIEILGSLLPRYYWRLNLTIAHLKEVYYTKEHYVGTYCQLKKELSKTIIALNVNKNRN